MSTPDTIPYASPAPPGSFISTRRKFLDADFVLANLARASGVIILLMLASLLVVLFYAARQSMHEFGFKFFTTSEWRPNELDRPQRDAQGHVMMDSDGNVIMETLPPTFGALPVIYGTAVSSTLALLFAIPLSLGSAIFLVRVAPTFLVPIVSFLIEFLAAIPSIAYGLWGLFVLAPFMADHFDPMVKRLLLHVPAMGWLFTEPLKIGNHVFSHPIPLTRRDMLTGSLVLAIMILPIITAISRDVLRQVPRAKSKARLPWAPLGGKAARKCLNSAARGSSALSCWASPGLPGKPWPSPWSSEITTRSAPRFSPPPKRCPACSPMNSPKPAPICTARPFAKSP